MQCLQNIAYISRKNIKNLYKFWYYWKRGEILMKWLHLSDLHIRENADWNIFRQELVEHCKVNGPIDLVIVTGDFHDFKDKDDFSLAESFLKELMEDLHLDISQDLFLIPGNHDGSYPIVEHKRGNVAVLKGDPTSINKKEWIELLSQFEAYENFVLSLIPEYPFNHPAREHCRTWRGKINFIHCNSAVVSDGVDKKDQMLDIDSFSKLCIDSELPSIILIHNHIDDINEEQRKRIIGAMRCSNIRAYFCGDRHIQEVRQIDVRDRQNCQIPCVASYKSAPDISDKYSTNGVIIGTWNEEKAKLKGWSWEIEKSFEIDSQITGQTIEMGVCFNHQNKEEKWMASTSLIDKNEDKKNEIERSKEGGADKERQIRLLYFNMSETQIEKVNRKIPANVRKLGCNETLESMREFVVQLNEKKCLDEILYFMKNLFEEM